MRRSERAPRLRESSRWMVQAEVCRYSSGFTPLHSRAIHVPRVTGRTSCFATGTSLRPNRRRGPVPLSGM